MLSYRKPIKGHNGYSVPTQAFLAPYKVIIHHVYKLFDYMYHNKSSQIGAAFYIKYRTVYPVCLQVHFHTGVHSVKSTGSINCVFWHTETAQCPHLVLWGLLHCFGWQDTPSVWGAVCYVKRHQGVWWHSNPQTHIFTHWHDITHFYIV